MGKIVLMNTGLPHSRWTLKSFGFFLAGSSTLYRKGAHHVPHNKPATRPRLEAEELRFLTRFLPGRKLYRKGAHHVPDNKPATRPRLESEGLRFLPMATPEGRASCLPAKLIDLHCAQR